ncbi:MAG: FHA domain-containing protein, partial [bacterium]
MKKKAKIIPDKTKGSASTSSTLEVNELQDQEVQDKEAMPSDLKSKTVAQFFIFQGEDCLGWECFHKETVTIGKGKDVDIVLNGQNVSDLHAFFYLKNGQITVSDGNLGSGVRVNGKFITDRILGPLDCVTIGPYTIKVKVKNILDQAPNADETQANIPEFHKGGNGKRPIYGKGEEDKQDEPSQESTGDNDQITKECIDDQIKQVDFERPEGGPKTSDPVMNTQKEDEKTEPESKEMYPEVQNEVFSELMPESDNDSKVISPSAENRMKETLSAAEENDDKEVINPPVGNNMAENPQEAEEVDDQQGSVIEALREEASSDDVLADEKAEDTEAMIADEVMTEPENDSLGEPESDIPPKLVNDWLRDDLKDIDDHEHTVESGACLQDPSTDAANTEIEETVSDEVMTEPENDSLGEPESDIPPKRINDWLGDDYEPTDDHEHTAESGACLQDPSTDTVDKDNECTVDADSEFTPDTDHEFTPDKNGEHINADNMIEQEQAAGQERTLEDTSRETPAENIMDYSEDIDDKEESAVEALSEDVLTEDALTFEKNQDAVPEFMSEPENSSLVEPESHIPPEPAEDWLCDDHGDKVDSSAFSQDPDTDIMGLNTDTGDKDDEFTFENEISQAEEKPEAELNHIIDRISDLEKLGSDASVEQEVLPGKPQEESGAEVNPTNQTSSGGEPNFELESEQQPQPELEAQSSQLFTRENSESPETGLGQVKGNNERRIEADDDTEELF